MNRGVHAILYALFDERERLDRAAMQRQVNICLAADVAGVAALGLATETAKLTFEERQTIISWVAADVKGKVPLTFTIAGASVAEQVALLRCAEQVGACSIILQPPAVGSYPAEEYMDFFSRVMEATRLPVAIQNAPQYLGRGLSNQDIVRLRDGHANFTLIKSESAAADVSQLISAAGSNLRIFNGRGGMEMIECLDVGCEGFLLAPDLVDYGVRAMLLYDAGDRAAALSIHERMIPAINFVMQSIEHLICYGKRLFGLRAGFAIHDRAPALRPNPAGLEVIAQFAKSLGGF